FLALSLFMGMQGESQLAANQIVLQFLGLIIAVVFSTAQAVTVRMSHLIGEGKMIEADKTSLAGIFISFSFILLVAICYWVFPNVIIGFDLDLSNPSNQQVITYAKQFLAIAAVFQLLESIRITLFGSLRALKETHFTLLTSIISLWLIALPVGYLLARIGLGAMGFWYGLIIGAACSAILLRWRYRVKIKSYLRMENRA
ncbi:MAG: MATE family efflux transporter, partial [Gammaproteobacteria bacterium]